MGPRRTAREFKMSETALKIALDSTSTFEVLRPIRDELAGADGDSQFKIEPELAEDTPQTVLFALGQILCAAANEGRIAPTVITEFSENNDVFGAMFTRTGFENMLPDAA